jgi:hypothetical protein
MCDANSGHLPLARTNVSFSGPHHQKSGIEFLTRVTQRVDLAGVRFGPKADKGLRAASTKNQARLNEKSMASSRFPAGY